MLWNILVASVAGDAGHDAMTLGLQLADALEAGIVSTRVVPPPDARFRRRREPAARS